MTEIYRGLLDAKADAFVPPGALPARRDEYDSREDAMEAALAIWRKYGQIGMPFIMCTTLSGDARYVAGVIEIGPGGK
jgi:hypothetical protein